MSVDNVSNQDDLALIQSAIFKGERSILRKDGFTAIERFPAVPRFAPEGSITITTALDLLGRALYGSDWTGEERTADHRPEPTDEELATKAFGIVTREASESPGGELAFRTEAEVFRELLEQREIEFAPQRRRHRVAGRLIGLLYRGVLKAAALSSEEGEIAIPPRIWAATAVMCLFYNGGYIEARAGTFRIPREPRPDEHGVVLLDQKQLEEVVNDPSKMTAVRPEPDKAEVKAVHPYKTNAPGRPTVSHLAIAEFANRARRGVVEPTLKAESEALVSWLKENYPNAPNLTPKTVETKIRMAYWQFKRSLK